jgi:predicted aconitase with swiveling domain
MATVTLPAGTTVGPGRETAQTNASGQVVQGMVFPVTTPKGSTTSVFVPYSLLHNTAAVEESIKLRVDHIIAIGG